MQNIEMSFITESDVYRLVFNSKLPSAEKFTDWVTEEILPALRKTGGYIVGEEAMSDDELMAAALTLQNEIMQPKAEYFDKLVEKNLLTNLRTTAKELHVKEREFVGWLLDNRYLYRDAKGKLMPYAQYANVLFEIKEAHNDGSDWAGTQTLVTPKGRETFRLLTENKLESVDS